MSVTRLALAGRLQAKVVEPSPLFGLCHSVDGITNLATGVPSCPAPVGRMPDREFVGELEPRVPGRLRRTDKTRPMAPMAVATRCTCPAALCPILHESVHTSKG
jgi:hypothetical protein